MEKPNLLVSVAMATFNGAQYLEEQFESLFAQTRMPDEVIVYDDASNDETAILLNQIKNRAPFRMKVIAGKENAGVHQAFQTALSYCSGEIVLFCDQDDFWECEKIARMIAVFDADPDVGLVFSNASQINENGGFLPRSLWAVIGFDEFRQSLFRQCPMGEMLKGGNFIYGMAAAFRAAAIKDLAPMSNAAASITHDTWFAFHALGAGWKGVALDELLVRYRRHEHQVTKMAPKQVMSGARTSRSLARNKAILNEIISLEEVRRSLSSFPFVRDCSAVVKNCRLLKIKIRFLRNRLAIRNSRRMMTVFRHDTFAGYYRYASGVRSIFRDIIGS